MNANDEGIERRLAAIQQILKQYGLESTSVTTLAYVMNSPFRFNNFIYKVELASPALPSSFPSPLPGTVPPPAEGVSTVVIRFSNPIAEGLNNTHRVQNEIAAQSLARASLAKAGLPNLVPDVYAWSGPKFGPDGAAPDESGFGWMLAGLKPGADLDGEFRSLTLDEKKDVADQIAAVFAALQKSELPPAVDKFGALTFDEDGNMVSGQMPLLQGGPWSTYAETWAQKIRTQLVDADKSPVLNGWKEGGMRERIEKFVTDGGIEKVLEGVDVSQKGLIHGDFTMNNVLFDSGTKRITSLLDFDFSSVSHPAEEFLTGLWDIGGGLNDSRSLFHDAIMTGDFSVTPENLSEEDAGKWEVAKAWQAATVAHGVLQPSSIAGIRKIESLRRLEVLVAPFHLSSPVMLKRNSAEVTAKKLAETTASLSAWLTDNGV